MYEPEHYDVLPSHYNDPPCPCEDDLWCPAHSPGDLDPELFGPEPDVRYVDESDVCESLIDADAPIPYTLSWWAASHAG